MNWSWFDSITNFFTEIGDFTVFLAEAWLALPDIFIFVITFVLLVSIFVGATVLIFKLLG